MKKKSACTLPDCNCSRKGFGNVLSDPNVLKTLNVDNQPPKVFSEAAVDGLIVTYEERIAKLERQLGEAALYAQEYLDRELATCQKPMRKEITQALRKMSKHVNRYAR